MHICFIPVYNSVLYVKMGQNMLKLKALPNSWYVKTVYIYMLIT